MESHRSSIHTTCERNAANPLTMVSAKIHANGPRYNSETNKPLTPV
jgi:hypothetical protein